MDDDSGKEGGVYGPHWEAGSTEALEHVCAWVNFRAGWTKGDASCRGSPRGFPFCVVEAATAAPLHSKRRDSTLAPASGLIITQNKNK